MDLSIALSITLSIALAVTLPAAQLPALAHPTLRRERISGASQRIALSKRQAAILSELGIQRVRLLSKLLLLSKLRMQSGGN